MMTAWSLGFSTAVSSNWWYAWCIARSATEYTCGGSEVDAMIALPDARGENEESLGFIAALLLAALALGFITVTANAAPATLNTATGLEVQIDAPGAAGVVVEGVAREAQPLLHAVVLVPHKEPADVHLAHLARRCRLLVRGSPISRRRDDDDRNPLAVLL